MILFNADPNFICKMCATLRMTIFHFISYKGYQDTRLGRIALPSFNKKNPWRQLRLTGAKQPSVMIGGGID